MYTIVVPTFNRANSLEMNISSLLVQDIDDSYEVLVVDNNSTDDTRARVQALGTGRSRQLRYIFESEQGVSAARNAGVAAAHGEVIAFIDDDAIAEPGWLRALANVYREYPDAWCVGGKIVLRLPDERSRWFSNHSESLKGYLSACERGDATATQDDTWKFVYGANFSVRRDVLSRVGPFDKSLGVAGPNRFECDELDLCWRIRNAGGAVYYCGAAVVTHVVPSSRLSKRFFCSRAHWRGRTSRLLHGKDLEPKIRPYHLVRAGLRVALNWISSWTSGSEVTETRIFEAQLEFWRRLGYLQQAVLMRFPRRKSHQSGIAKASERTPFWARVLRVPLRRHAP